MSIRSVYKLGDGVELSVLVQQTAGNGYRAWCGAPVPAEAEGTTREDALTKLRATLEAKTRGVEVVRLSIGVNAVASPLWPDDQVTHDWLAGIADSRRAADQTPDPWDEPAAGQP